MVAIAATLSLAFFLARSNYRLFAPFPQLLSTLSLAFFLARFSLSCKWGIEGSSQSSILKAKG